MSKETADSCAEVIEQPENIIETSAGVEEIADTDKSNNFLRNRRKPHCDEEVHTCNPDSDPLLDSCGEHVTYRQCSRSSAHTTQGSNSLQCGDNPPEYAPSVRVDTKHLDLSSSTQASVEHTSEDRKEENADGFMSYLWSELSRGYEPDENEAQYNVKKERVLAFLRVPTECERFMLYAFLQCIDSFLFIFTFLPLRLIIIILKLLSRPWTLCMPHYYLTASQRCDMVKGILIAMGCFVMYYVDASMVYHIIRGQSIIKLYIFLNLLEIGDRLLSSFGQDILDALMWTVADRQSHGMFLVYLITGVIYVFLHSMLVLLQASALNVAFNSHANALLTILISNNAVELKGSVFKRFEKTNLFQISCSDARERFHLHILIFIVCLRNMTDFNWDIEKFQELIPKILWLAISEVIVDETKHAFITKFNNIPSDVYREYTVLLANDVISSRKKNAFSDVSDQVSRRLGLIPLPLACLLIRIVSQCLKIQSPLAVINLLLAFLCLFGAKLVIGVVVYGWAVDYCNAYQMKQAKLSKRQRHQSVSGIDKDLLKCENNYHFHMKRTNIQSPSSTHAAEPAG